MKTHLFLASSIYLAASPFLVAQTPPIRIMPLGDSITDGSSFDSPDGTGGYRGPLYTLLSNAGYNVDYVGSSTVNSGQLVEKEHDGHSGWRIDQIDSSITGWLNNIEDPDVVLMHIGTNDFGQNYSTSTAINRLDALILKIATLRPHTHIIVTNLMERDSSRDTAIQSQFNPQVESVVNNHAAAGRRVTFLDMRSKVPLSDMPDQLHPDQNGYNKMAAAWLPAIQAVISPLGDSLPPEISRAIGDQDHTHVRIRFSKPVSDLALNPANYSITGDIAVTHAELDASRRIVTLTTSPQTPNTTYTITVNGITDLLQPSPNSIAPHSTVDFVGAIARGYSNHVAESADYSLVYSIDLPNDANYLSNSPSYTVNTSSSIGPFDRIAYYLELQGANGTLQYAWVSMDPFTNDASKIAIPTASSGAIFQQPLTNLNIISNVPGLSTGTSINGQIEFWPTNYEPPNTSNVPGASNVTYDFGDSRLTSGRHGSMQIHNLDAAQTVFAFNNWGSLTPPGDDAQDIALGIGNSTGTHPDWTFANNGSSYSIKTLQVLVRRTGDLTAPSVTSAQATSGRNRIFVHFDEPVLASSLDPSLFTLDNGVSILGVSALSNPRLVEITTTEQPQNTPLTLTLSGIRDTSPNANLITPLTQIAVTTASLPEEISTHIGNAADGYQLVYSYELPTTGNFNDSRGAIYYDDSSSTGTFSRIAYYLELQQPGQASRYIWTSMDAFTANRAKIGLPTRSSGAAYQRNVSNLQVISNASGITNGSNISTGNIEFWPDNYNQANGNSIPGASTSTHDFGDTRTANGSYYGSMQVHNYGASQTLFAINNFGTDGNVLDLGIGNSTGAHPDWTFAANANSYSRRILHVLVLPASTAPATITSKVPEAANYQLLATVNLPANGNLSGGSGSPGYAFDFRNEVGPFRRVAYYLELKKSTDAQASYIWTSMDAFSNQASRVCVPNTSSGAFFQQNVTNLNVTSNVPGVVNGTGITTGNIEFWPSNYNATNSANVSGASNTAYDFGDGGAGTSAGYGSMQVHNRGASQTLFAINNWGASNNTSNALCLGIGNQPSGEPDWTFANNAPSYNQTRLLHILVLPGDTDTTKPTITKVTPSTGLDAIAVTFSEPLADPSASIANFTVNPGLTITSATLSSSKTEIILTTTPQTPGSTYTLTASHVRDRSPGGNLITPNTSTTFTAFTPPPALNLIPETSDYQLVYQLDLPSASPRWNVNGVPYSVDQSRFAEFSFDRVAYLMTLDSNWIYTSFDRHTDSIRKIGIPTTTVTTTPFQQKISNLNVATNLTSLYPDPNLRTGLTGGNIEFWGGNYEAANQLSIPNASGSTFDWGDRMTSGGHGCFQVHDHENSRVLFAINNWGSNSGQTVDLGIGTRPSGDPDWTFAANANSFTTRRLYVLARPSLSTPTGPAPQIVSHPTSRAVYPGTSTTLSVQLAGQGPFTYQWRFQGENLSGQNNPWLDLPHFSAAQVGSYDVVVTSATGVTSTSLAASVQLASTQEPFDQFLLTHNLSDPQDDRDHDGIPALLEWFLHGHPDLTDASILPKGEHPTPGTFRFTFLRPQNLGSVTWRVEAGNGLSTWTTAVHGTNGTTITEGSPVNDSIPVTVTFTGTTSPFFARLIVSRPE